MPRVEVADVQAIFPTTVNVMPFILAASTLVDLYFTGSGYGVTQLAELERFWAAHLASATSPTITSKTLGDTKIDYQQRRAALNLNSTLYGETVLLLDTDHLIAAAQAAEAEAVTLRRASFFMD